MPTKSSRKTKKCFCDNPTCSKCLGSDCQDDKCSVHTMVRKVYWEGSRNFVPTYKQILSMNYEDFKHWLWERAKKKNVHALISEMIKHEEKNLTFTKYVVNEFEDPIRKPLILLFRKNSKKTTLLIFETFRKIDRVYRKKGLKTKGMLWHAVVSKASNDLSLLREVKRNLQTTENAKHL